MDDGLRRKALERGLTEEEIATLDRLGLLETAIKKRKKVDPIDAFKQAHSDDLATLYSALSDLREALESFNEERGTSLTLKLDADSLEKLVGKARSSRTADIVVPGPTGSPTAPDGTERSFAALATKYLGTSLFFTDKTGVEHSGTLIEGGKVEADGVTYDTPGRWVTAFNQKGGGNIWRTMKIEVDGERMNLEDAFKK